MSEYFKFSEIHHRFFKKHGEKVMYDKDQHLAWQNDESGWVFFLAEGLVQVSFSFNDGTRRIIGYFVPGISFAQIGSFFEESDGRLTYAAKDSLIAYRVRRSDFLKELETDVAFSKDYLEMTLRNQIFLINRIVYQGEKGIHGKCARWLLFMSKHYGVRNPKNPLIRDIPINMTQDVIADFLHATRESINVILKKMQKEGLIAMKGKRISILDEQRIRASVESKTP